MARIPVLLSEIYQDLYTVSPDGTKLSGHNRSDFKKDGLVPRGLTGTMNGIRYWIYRDESGVIRLCGENIKPIAITDDVSVSLTHKEAYCLTVKKAGKTLLSIVYRPEEDPIPPEHDFTAASMDDESGDFGKSIYRLLNNNETRPVIWTDAW